MVSGIAIGLQMWLFDTSFSYFALVVIGSVLGKLWKLMWAISLIDVSAERKRRDKIISLLQRVLVVCVCEGETQRFWCWWSLIVNTLSGLCTVFFWADNGPPNSTKLKRFYGFFNAFDVLFLCLAAILVSSNTWRSGATIYTSDIYDLYLYLQYIILFAGLVRICLFLVVWRQQRREDAVKPVSVPTSIYVEHAKESFERERSTSEATDEIQIAPI